MCEREREISKTLESVSEYVDVCGGGEREWLNYERERRSLKI